MYSRRIASALAPAAQSFASASCRLSGSVSERTSTASRRDWSSAGSDGGGALSARARRTDDRREEQDEDDAVKGSPAHAGSITNVRR